MRIQKYVTKKRAALTAAILLVAVVLNAWRCMQNRSSQIAHPKIAPIVDAVYALGTVKSEHVYSLRMGVTDGIVRLHVSEGEQVRKGQPLLNTEAGVSFHAPFSGIVSKVFYEEGETVMPGTTVLTLVDPSTIYLLVSLDQQSAVKVTKRQEVELSFEGMRNRKYTGMVERIYSSSGQFLARIYSQELPPGILPDMTVDVAIAVAKKEKALLIPTAAIREGSVTLIRNNQRLTLRPKTGIVNEGWTEIMDGTIKTDDEILVMKK